DVLILQSRCHPQEAIPFKAVDGVVDQLSRFLVRQSRPAVEAMMPRDVGALARVFRVLARVPAIAAMTRAPVEGEPHEIRRRAYVALRELFARVSDRLGVVVWIDDLQWGDLDSVGILREIQRPPDSPRLLLVLSYRSEDREGCAVLRSLAT